MSHIASAPVRRKGKDSVRISFDGPTCSGKSLLLYAVRDALRERGVTIEHTDEHELTACNVVRALVPRGRVAA